MTKKSKPLWLSNPHYGELRGRKLERQVLGALVHLKKQEGFITSLKYNQPNSPEDRLGRDFTVVRNGIEFSFGVSRNAKRAESCSARHGIPVLHITDGSDVYQLVKELIRNFTDVAEGGNVVFE